MYDDIVKRLESFGYIVDPIADDWVLDFLIGKVTETVKNECNVDMIPDGLRYIAVDMVCGEFLNAKRGSGQLTDFDAEEAVKQIKEGDTTITYAIGDAVSSFDGLISYLTTHGKSQFVAFRRLAW